MSDTGFFAHNMDIVDTELKIKDYTDRKRFGNKIVFGKRGEIL